MKRFSVLLKKKSYKSSSCDVQEKAVLAAGGYQHFPLFEDYYLWVRMLMNGAKFYNIQESLLYFRSSPDMFKRRGGLKYVGTEVRFQNFLLRSHFISFPRYVQNVIIRVITRIMPNRWRALYIKKAKIANMFYCIQGRGIKTFLLY